MNELNGYLPFLLSRECQCQVTERKDSIVEGCSSHHYLPFIGFLLGFRDLLIFLVTVSWNMWYSIPNYEETSLFSEIRILLHKYYKLLKVRGIISRTKIFNLKRNLSKIHFEYNNLQSLNKRLLEAYFIKVLFSLFLSYSVSIRFSFTYSFPNSRQILGKIHFHQNHGSRS